MQTLMLNFIEIFTESAPWLLLGLLIAGLMKWLVPMSLLNQQLGKDNWQSVIKAALIGAPLPLCSCGVIPAAIGLRRAGASKSASIAFLVATPETGVDSISISYALLGPFMAIIRPIAAILSAIFAGFLVMFLTLKEGLATVTEGEKVASANGDASGATNSSPVSSCCPSDPVVVKKSCCERAKLIPKKLTVTENLMEVYAFSSGKLLIDITPWLLAGLLLAAAVNTWVPIDFLTQWGGGFSAMLVMALVGIPMYICATASTPLAAGFIAAGVSPGAVMVFMLAGPATNISTMGMIRREMGTSILLVYLFSILSSSIGIGYAVNWAVAEFMLPIKSVTNATHAMSSGWLFQLSAVLLALLMLKNYFFQIKQRYLSAA